MTSHLHSIAIFVHDLDRVIRIRTGELDGDAL